MTSLSPSVLIVFNGVGVMLSVCAVALVVHLAAGISGALKHKFISLLRGFGLIGFSFLWTLLFGQLITPSRLLTIQSVLLSAGMAFLIHSANKLFEIYEREKVVTKGKRKGK